MGRLGVASRAGADPIMLDKLDVECPSCQRGTIKFSLQDVANHRIVRCSAGCRVELEDEGGGARQADRDLRKLDKSLRDLNRRLG